MLEPVCYLPLQGSLFGNGGLGGSESPLGGLGGIASSMSSAHKQMMQAQPSLRDPSKGMYIHVRDMLTLFFFVLSLF